MSTPDFLRYFSHVDSFISECDKNTNVYKDECVFSMEAPDDKDGLFICLKTFLGIGPTYIHDYVKKTQNRIFLNFKIIKKFKGKSNNGYLIFLVFMVFSKCLFTPQSKKQVNLKGPRN